MFLALLLAAFFLALVAWTVVRGGTLRALQRGERATTMVVLGSGGHTAEMLTLLRGLDPTKYASLTFVVAATDRMGAAKAQQALSLRGQPEGEPAVVDVIPRSREVGQSYITSVATTLRALAAAFTIVWRRRPDLLLVNGPGTCIPICAAALLLRAFGLAKTHIVYVESIARVTSLSLSGRILYHSRIASAFFVQWPALHRRYPRSTYQGRLY
eukprot:CAMPEP_0206134952 /NCGR_PEP_ID=MMETSP1473-20131121/331_1 /ASSEMBLY_ACC=CAM_ASM_001109 /TAXON_ID=1461547 /ORGANISM="Stichococcus sp, Strain RCC1054" /LENGTH=212 /DNA_ID=CAMNT_0053526609 /DNA_START=392 /DNA_END=1030 /DNA_ORIENTATION=+